MSCRTIQIQQLPIKSHKIEYEIPIEYEIETSKKSYKVDTEIKTTYKFEYCIAYRHPNLPEWIVARGYWNDEGLRFADGVWRDQ